MISPIQSKKKVLFLCTGNSCRSQMAEGLARHLVGDGLEFYSAGTAPHVVDALAITVMKEIGIDISSHYSKSVHDLTDIDFDYVVTVCAEANENCPFWPGRGKARHRGFPDPPRLVANLKDEQEILSVYRRVRDEIRDYIETLPSSLETSP